MKKKVNIYPRGPITSVNPPIRVPVRNITKDTKDIRKCIIAGAKVEECTPNGPIELNLQNYDLDNGGNYEAIKTGLKMSLIDENEKAIASGLTATNTAPDTSVSPMQHTFEKPEALQAKIDKIEQDKIARQDIISARRLMACGRLKSLCLEIMPRPRPALRRRRCSLPAGQSWAGRAGRR